MFNLNQASESIRKASAMNGVWSGKFEPIFDNDREGYDAVIAKVYNRNHPDGVSITCGEADHALSYTWQEIRNNR